MILPSSELGSIDGSAEAGSEAGAEAGSDAGAEAGAVGGAVGPAGGAEPREHAAAITATTPSMESRPRRDIWLLLVSVARAEPRHAERRHYGASGSSAASRRRNPASSSTGIPSSAAFWS